MRRRILLSSPTLLISGSSGFIGSALSKYYRAKGYQVIALKRSSGPDDFQWMLEGGRPIPSSSRIDAVIHLAGENLGTSRWRAEKKARILESRACGTRRLCEAIAILESKPRVVICASAIGFYGNRPGEELTETSTRGRGFLAEVCEQWEKACDPARNAGIRVVNTRFGVVLDPSGGILAKMIPPFRLGLGGAAGNGKQFVSWISMSDLMGAIDHCLKSEILEGPVNLVSPTPVTNLEFAQILASVLGRRALGRLPETVLRLVLGEFAEETILASTKAVPAKLLRSGYVFKYPDLLSALNYLTHSLPSL